MLFFWGPNAYAEKTLKSRKVYTTNEYGSRPHRYHFSGSWVKIHPKNFSLSLVAYRGYSTYDDRNEVKNIIFRCKNEVNFFQEFRPGSMNGTFLRIKNLFCIIFHLSV
jgi:hypothetical protein